MQANVSRTTIFNVGITAVNDEVVVEKSQGPGWAFLQCCEYARHPNGEDAWYRQDYSVWETLNADDGWTSKGWEDQLKAAKLRELSFRTPGV